MNKLESELRAAQVKEKAIDDQEQFLLNELAAQVSDLDCKSHPLLVFLYLYPDVIC